MIDLLFILLLSPILGAIGVAVVPRRAIRWTALGVSIAPLLLSLTLLARFKMHTAGLFGTPIAAPGPVILQATIPWLVSPPIEIHLGLDGLSLPLVLLTAFLFVVAVVVSWRIEKGIRGFFPLLFLLEAGVLGTFLSLDAVVLCACVMFTLIPIYLFITGWGTDRKEIAAMKFVLTMLLAVGLLLVALLVIDLNVHSFDLIQLPGLIAHKCATSHSFTRITPLLFLLILVAALSFSAAVPPFHGWLAEALAEAPTAISIVLCSVMMKLGIYLLLRIVIPLFPSLARHFWLPLAILGIASLFYGALCAVVQADFKRLIAFLSISQMGLAICGIVVLSPVAMSGASLLLVGHGLSVALLFLISDVIENRASQRDLTLFGGLATTMPRLWAFSAAGFFFAIGMPASSLFVAQFMIVMGTFAAMSPDGILATAGLAYRGSLCSLGILELVGLLLNAGALLWGMQRIFLSPQRPEQKQFADLDEREITLAAVILGASLLLGIFPGQIFFSMIARSERAIVEQFAGQSASSQPASLQPATSPSASLQPANTQPATRYSD